MGLTADRGHLSGGLLVPREGCPYVGQVREVHPEFPDQAARLVIETGSGGSCRTAPASPETLMYLGFPGGVLLGFRLRVGRRPDLIFPVVSYWGQYVAAAALTKNFTSVVRQPVAARYPLVRRIIVGIVVTSDRI